MNFTIWLTEKCNMMCSYCYERRAGLEPMSMSMDTAKKVVRYVKRIITQDGRNKIHFHGGEVFENIDVLSYLVEELNGHQFKLHLTTNGTMLIDEQVRKILLQMAGVSISIDGDEEVYSRNRRIKDRSFTYSALLDNISMLLNVRPDSCARLTISPNTYKDIERSIEYIINLGFKKINYSVDYYNKQWKKKQITELIQKVKSLSQISERYTNVQIEGIGNCIPRPLSPCTGGILHQDLYVDGLIYPCTAVANERSFCIGNVEQGIKINVEKQLELLNSQELARCYNCQNLSSCRANRCRYVNYGLTGNLYSPSEIMCQIEKEVMRQNENCGY